MLSDLFAKFTELDYDESNETVNSMQPESITFSSKMNTGTGKRYSSEKFRHKKEEKNNVPF